MDTKPHTPHLTVMGIVLAYAALVCAVLSGVSCDDMLDAEKPIYKYFLNNVSIIGTAVPAGWDIEDYDQITMMNYLGGRAYQWEGTLAAGELKFAWQKPDFATGSWYMAGKPDLAVETDVPYEMVFVQSDVAENNWLITNAGSYRISLDLFAKTVVFSETGEVITPVGTFAAIYVIGAATPGGWALDNASPMTKGDANSWTWTGALTTNNLQGGLKFICKINSSDTLEYAHSPEFRPTAMGTVPTGTVQDLLYVPDGSTVNNNTFTIDTAGTYTITLHPSDKQVIFTRN